MKSLCLFQVAIVLITSISASSIERIVPPGCRTLRTDADWPSFDAWKAELPGVVPLKETPGVASPDYRLRVTTAEEVQKAINFANKHNIRVSVIATGHDFLGRNTAASGLLIDVSMLDGINVLESFTPTKKGVKDVKSGQKANIISPKPGTQAAVTIGGGVMTAGLNKALSPSKLFTMGAGHGKDSSTL
jgi:FAD/FMN-containing dehydrogenase